MGTDPTKTGAGSPREAVLTGLLVAVSFGIFLGVIHFAFPEGTSLRGLLRPSGDTGTAGALRDLALGGPREEVVATLERVVRTVKDKPVSAIAWRDARRGTELGGRHSIQTAGQSSATISFGENASVTLGENSLLVLKTYDAEEDGSDRRAILEILGGELSGALAIGGAAGGGAGLPVALEVETPHGKTQLRPGAESEGPTRFRVDVKEKEGSSTISVLEGSADVITREGERLRLRPRQAVSIREGLAAPAPVELPREPALRAPDDGSRLVFRAQPPKVEFRWYATGDADSWRFVLARDRTLDRPLFEAVVQEPQASHGNLEAGTWWWAVAARRGGLEGLMSPPRRLVLTRDEKPPALDVAWPEGEVSTKSYRLRGRTEAASRVFVADRPAEVGPDGAFEIDVALTRGANVIVVESVDVAGNSTYESRMIQARY